MESVILELKSLMIRPGLRLSNESDLQVDLEKIFASSKYSSFKREYRFNERDRIDFFEEKLGIGIEVKIKGNSNEILKQLERYAKNEQVKALVLATAYFMGLPPDINGKPLYFFHLSKGML